MTSGNFFQIKPDFKPGTIRRDSENQHIVYRPKDPPNTTKDFKQILAKEHENEIPEEKDNIVRFITSSERGIIKSYFADN